MELLKKLLDNKILQNIVIFIILQILTYWFIRRKQTFNNDVNLLINKIQEKVNYKNIIFMPKISKITIKKIRAKCPELYNEIEEFLNENKLHIEDYKEKSSSLINKLMKL